MSHSLISGMTESGKSTLAKMLCSQFKEQGIGTIVYSAIDLNGWNCDFKTSNIESLKQSVNNSRLCMVFIDEADTVCSLKQPENNFLAVRSRHRQHSVYFITQRPNMINPNIRGQCKNLFLFNIHYNDAKDLSKQWNCDEIMSSVNFKVGEYIYVPRMGQYKKMKLF